jgi:hypothetical protein
MQRKLWQQRYHIGAESGRRGATTAVLYNGVDTDRFAAPCADRGAGGNASRPTALLDTKYIIGTVG